MAHEVARRYQTKDPEDLSCSGEAAGGQRRKPTRRAASPDLTCPELDAVLEKDPEAASAFAALTPGRRREYAAHINAAKREATREKRALDALPLIRAGKGLNDKYK